jgi:hypothetical protein
MTSLLFGTPRHTWWQGVIDFCFIPIIFAVVLWMKGLMYLLAEVLGFVATALIAIGVSQLLGHHLSYWAAACIAYIATAVVLTIFMAILDAT